MAYDWVVVLNNQPVTELLVSPLNESISLADMEEVVDQVSCGRVAYLTGKLFAWQLGREETLYTNLRQGQRVTVPSESILFLTVMQRKPK